ncbi:MAG: DUF805 domain-containing protein [Porphyromonas sp.]|nr:DUF805 domain-containing protein [Porphyromonas sp.]
MFGLLKILIGGIIRYGWPCYVRRPLDFRGRATRRDYWFTAALFAVLVNLGFFLGLIFLSEWIKDEILLMRIGYGMMALIALPVLSAMVRRLHDRGHGAWPVVLYIALVLIYWQVPSAWLGLGFYILNTYLLVMMCLPGQVGANKYGPDPRDEDELYHEVWHEEYQRLR